MRKGMMKGSGKRGYHNIIGKDPMVHSQSAKGIKQPQQFICEGGLKRMPKPVKNQTISTDKETLKEIGGLVGIHPSSVIEGVVTPIKKNKHYAIFLRTYMGGYLVEAIQVRYKPFNYERIRYYQTEDIDDAKRMIKTWVR